MLTRAILLSIRSAKVTAGCAESLWLVYGNRVCECATETESKRPQTKERALAYVTVLLGLIYDPKLLGHTVGGCGARATSAAKREGRGQGSSLYERASRVSRQMLSVRHSAARLRGTAVMTAAQMVQ